MTGTSATTTSTSSRPADAARLRFGDCEICRQTRVLWHRGEPREIRRKALDVLLLLIDHRPQTLSHERIAREVWGSKARGAQHVARAVMDARRTIGDDTAAPKYLLSVRGLGYRFAADVTLSEVGDAIEAESEGAGALAAHADIEAAGACLRRGDFDEARRLADRAIASADLAGARPELARALALAGSILLRVGSREHALTLATKAMRMAQFEGRSDVLAEVQLGLAEVQLWLGSGHAALDNLLVAHRALSDRGPSLNLWRCERTLCEAYRELGRPADAWTWGECAQSSALRLEPQNLAVRERLTMVGILHIRMDMADTEGRHDEVQTHGQQTLDLLSVIEPDARAIGLANYEVVSQTYRAISLEAMGRVHEGWAALEALHPVLFGANVDVTTWLEFRRREFRHVEAGLLSRSGRHVEAIQKIEAAFESALALTYLPIEPAVIQGIASKICERAGLHKEALTWMRRQQRSFAKLHADRAQATADIVRAQLESDRLGEELAMTRAEVERLTQINQELEGRIVQMERHPLLDEGGLVPAAALVATINGRAALARERELPLCVGVVEVDSTHDPSDPDAALLLRRRMKLLSAMLKAVIPEASAAAQWKPGQYFFIISDMGLGPARSRCQALAKRLNAEMIPTSIPEQNASVRADALDIARLPSLEVALDRLTVRPDTSGF